MKRVVSLLLSLMIMLMPMTCAQAQLVLPGSVVTIESEAFVGDGSIGGNVTLPAGTKTIGDRAFANTDIYALWLPESVRSIGAGVLDGANAVYAVSMSPSMQIASGALDVPYLIGRSGTPAQAWAEANGVTFLIADELVWQGGFCYQLTYDEYGNHGEAKLLFARSEDVSGSVVIPEYVSGCLVSAVGSYAFTRLDGVTEINLPEAAAQPDTRVNWPDVPVTTYSGSQGESGMPEGATQVTFQYDHLTMVPGQSWWIGVMEELPEGEAQWIFESTDAAVVAVNEDGLAIAETTGEARLSVTIHHENGTVYYGEVSVTVEEPEIDVWFYEDEITIVVGSESWPQMDYSINATFEDDLVGDSRESDNEEVLRINEYGMLVGVAPGTATCTYTMDFAGAQASDTITVHVREPELALNYYHLYAYETLQYQLVLTGELPEDAGVAFQSSDEEILTVDEDGLVSALKEGMATVTCTVVYADGTTAQEECVFDVSGFTLEWASTEPIEVRLGETGEVWPGEWIQWWWNHHVYAIVTIEVEDESVISYERSELPLADEKNATAHKLGTTNVTYTVSFNPPEAVEGRTITQTLPVTVVEPYMEAHLDPDWIEFDRVGDVCGLAYWHDSEIEIDRAYFTSSDESVATVSPNGVVTARGVGEATITYHIEARGIEKTASTQVMVHGKEFALSDSEQTIARYESFTLAPVYEAGEGDDVSVNFMSSNPAVAYVDGDGVVSGVAAGTAVITCELNSNSGNSRAQCVVTVTDDAAAITLNRTELTLCRGDSFTLVPAFSGEATDVTFESSNEDLVTVDENGCVTVVTDWYEFDFFPYITCRATVDGKSEAAQCIVRYAEPDAFIAGSAGRISLVQDEMHEIGLFITRTGADVTYTVAFESADEHIATVDDAGVVTAVGAGVTTVTVRLLAPDGALYDMETVDVYVETPYTVPESLAFEHAHYLLNPEETDPQSGCNARAILYPQEMDRYYAIEYESLNPDVAGMAGDWLYAVQPGTADILATVRYEEDGEEKILQATAKVTVAELSVVADKETYEPGDIATLTIANFPEDLDYEFINWHFPDSSDECRWISQDGPTLKVRVRQPGNYWFNVDIRVNDQWWHNFDYELNAEGDWVEYRLSESDIRAAVGDLFGVWPQFGCAEIATVSSNPDVVAISEDDPCQMNAVGVGEAVITYTCTAENGEVKVLELNVTVAEPQWRMVSMDPIPDVMLLGYDYWCEMEMAYNGWDDLMRYVRYTISDETVARVDEENPRRIIPLSKGTFTLTATAEFAGRTEAMSKAITVSETQVYPQKMEIDLRSGFTYTMPLLTSGDREIDSVIWRSGDVSLASVDENGEVLVNSEEWRQVTIYADVTFTDGTKAYTSYRINIVPDSDVYLNAYHENDWADLSTQSWGSAPMETEFWIGLDTNADAREISVEWTNGAGDVVTFEEIEGSNHCGVKVSAVNAGEATLTCTVRIGELQEWSHDFHVTVREPQIAVYPPETSIEMWMGERRYIDWRTDEQDCGPTSTIELISSDESVVACDVHGNIQAIAPGTATVTRIVSIRGERVAQTSMDVTVYGVRVRAEQDAVTLERGEYTTLCVNIGEAAGDIEIYQTHWESGNNAIAVIDYDGVVYGAAPGTTYATAYVHTNHGIYTATCVVTVSADGETPAFALKESNVTLFDAQTYQMEYVTSLGGSLSVEWSSTGDVSVDENGVVTAYGSCGEDRYGTVICTARYGALTYTAYCNVTIQPRGVRIVNWCLGDGSWRGMSVGEVEELWECYVTTTGVTAQVAYESDNTDVIVVDEHGVVTAVGQGEAMVTMTVSGSNGEVWTAQRYYRVDMEHIQPMGIQAQEGTCVWHLDWGDCYVPVTVTPQYADYALEFSGYDENVVYIREDGWMEPRGAGRTSVQVSVRDTELTASFDLLMLDNSIALGAVNGETTLHPGDSVQLGFSGNVLWNEDEVDGIWYEYNQGWLQITDDGMLLCKAFEDEQTDVYVHVRFKNGREQEYDCRFTIDTSEPYFCAVVDGSPELIDCTNRSTGIEVRSNLEYTNVQYLSGNTKVATVDENGCISTVGIGETLITVTAAYAGQTLTDTLKVTVLPPETPVIFCCPEKQLIHVGETVPVYVMHENPFTCPPDHFYTSSDESVLTSDGYQEDWHAFTITGVAEGQATLTVMGEYDGMTAQHSVTVYVIP